MATSVARVFNAGDGWLGRHVLQITVGLVIGTACLWLAVHTTVPAAAAEAIMHADPNWLALALLPYALDLAVRVMRWRCMLDHLGQADRFSGWGVDEMCCAARVNPSHPRECIVVKVSAIPALHCANDKAIRPYRRYDEAALGPAWWINGKLLGHTTPSSEQVRLFDMFALVLRVAERLIWPLAGLSLIAAARRG